MITIPTGELVGLLSDAIPFSGTDKEFTLHNRVLLHWDGEMLHAEATDTLSYGHAYWHPNDDPDTESEQESLLDQWGGADEPWQITLELADAKDVVKNFKLGVKEWGIALHVDYDQQRDRLTIERNRDAAHSALRQDIDGRQALGEGMAFPRVEETLARLPEPADGRATDKVAFSAKRLAAFGKVRIRGPIEMDLRGRIGVADVRIGDRFVGAVLPAKIDDEPKPKSDAEPVTF